MSFWEDLSPGVKRYVMIGGALLVALLVFRQCVVSSAIQSSAPAQQRGIAR